VYDKNVHEQIFSKNVLFMNILKNVAHSTGAASEVGSATTSGGGKLLTVHYSRNTGSAAGSETLTLPTAGKQGYLQATIPMKKNYHTISLTDYVLEASKKSKEFLVNVLESEYNGAKNDMQRQLSRQGWGIGTGELFKLNGNPASTATDMIVDSPMVGKNPTDYIEVGNILRFGATAAHIGTVASITGNTTFTIEANALDQADNDIVYLAQSATQSNKDYEIMGMKGLIDDGANVATLEGLARATYLWWQSYVDDNTTQRSLTDALLHTTFLEAQKKGNPKYILTSWDVVSAYGQLLTPDRRYANANMELNGGFKGVDFNGLPMVADYDAPYDEAYFVDPSVLSVEDLGPIGFMNADGGILDRSATTPAYNATLRYYSNLAISAPNKCASLRDIVK
jgi:hypothetical protein